MMCYSITTAVCIAVNYEEWRSETCHQTFLIDLLISGISELVVFFVAVEYMVRRDANSCLSCMVVLSIFGYIVSGGMGAYLIGHGLDRDPHVCLVPQFLFIMVYVNAVVLYVAVGVLGILLLSLFCHACCDCMEGREGSCMD